MSSDTNDNQQLSASQEGDKTSTTIKSTFHGELVKTVVKHGEGFVRPQLESCCNVDIIVDDSKPKNIKDTIITSKLVETGKGINVTLGGSETEFMATLEKCLMTMKKKEVSKFTFDIPKEAVYDTDENGEQCDDAMSCNTLSVTLTLHNFSEPSPIWKLSSDEKYKLALLHKTKGTELFQKGTIWAAFNQYHTAVKYLICIPELSTVSMTDVMTNYAIEGATDVKAFKDLQCVCYLNLAACQAKVSNHRSVIENCTQALTLDPSSVKALYRRAVARMACEQVDAARSDLQRAQKLEPHNRAIASLLQSCRK